MSETVTTFETDTLWVDSILTTSVPIDWQAAYGEDGEGWTSYEAPSCPECGEYAAWKESGQSPYYPHEWQCANEDCENNGNEIDPFEDDSLTGPMMNYHYPLPDLDRVGDPNDAASRIADLPLCIVEFEGGGYSLALTGGGMDLSWEICEAFMRLGFLPPFRFARDLPRFAGSDGNREVLAGARRTMEVLRDWSIQGLERLTKEWSA